MTVRVRNLTALGLTSGIGSLLVGARQAGFEVLGNVEWRRYYFSKDPRGRNTCTENFPGAIFKNKIEDLTPQEIERVMNADLALSHPECGRYSQLSSMNTDQSDDPGDIPLFVDLVARLKPKFFIMDDLPKCFKAFPMREFSVRLPEYDLYPEWISNFHYGNVQKNRKRMFMVGAMKSERWAFRPGERENALTLRDVIGDLGEPRAGSNYPNHDPHVLDEIVGRGKHLETLGRDRAATYADLRDFFQSNPSGTILRYVSSTGKIKVKPSHATGYWNAHAHVLDGASLSMHPIRCLPYTIRERARIQGFPDDFVFYGTRLNAAGEWNHEKNNNIIKQTGKAMPIQFARYASEQVAAHLLGSPFESSGHRLIPPNPWVDDAKRWYCDNVGYSDQARACGECWLYSTCSIRSSRYGIGAAVKSITSAAPASADAATGGDLTSAGPTGLGSGKPSGDAGETGQAARPRRVAARTRSAPARSSRFAELPEGGEFGLFEEGES